MKKLLVFACMTFLFTGLTYAQKKADIKGAVLDTLNNLPIHFASVSILFDKDSILYRTDRTDEKGIFNFKDVDTGKYILLISFGDYADYVQKLAVNNSTDIDLKQLRIYRKTYLLHEVVIKSGRFSAIRLKGDTTEFAADSFKVQPNAKVEDLLRQLPSIQIDNKGRITAQGQMVKEVLVDGEEFFGDDPTLVTKNIRADMVDKVQVFDKTSKQAAFTGIDDGVKDKTINIKLKEDKKHGYFGKLEVGGGTNGVYEGQGMLNIFNGKEKFAAYGLVGNNGQVGLAGQDKDVFGSGAIGGNNGLDAWSGNYNGQGIPTIQTGGLHYDNKWNDDKLYVNGNYKIANLNIDGKNNSITQNTIPDAINLTTSTQQFKNHSLRNKADALFEITPNPNSTLDISVDASLNHKNTYSNYSQETVDEHNLLLNTNNRTISDVGDAQEINSSFLWNKKFLKKGRTLSVSLGETYIKSNTQGFLNSSINFYNGNNTADSIRRIDQFKVNKNASLNFNSKFVYTEPLSPYASLSANYGVTIQDEDADIRSFNRSADNSYDQLDNLYSNDYTFNQLTNRFGAGYNFLKKKLSLKASTDLGVTGFSQLDKSGNGAPFRRNYLNWYPQLRLRYSINSQRQITLLYNGQTVQPNISQLQPIASNNDPLNIYIGNPLLNPSFKHTFNLIIRDYVPIKDRTFLINSTYNIIVNPIIINTQTDASGKNIYTFSNLANGTLSDMNTYLLYSRKIPLWDLRLTSNSGITLSKFVNFTNNVKSITNANVYKIDAGISKVKTSKYDISINGNVSYNYNSTLVDVKINNNYWSYRLSPDINLYFPEAFQLHADGDYNFRQKTPAFNENFNQFILNAWVGKKFMKDILLIKLSGNDLLDQNSGFNRIATNNMITQNSYSTIRRNFMLTVIYDFNKANNKN